MTGPLDPRPGFNPDELRDGDGPEATDSELGAAWAMARELGTALGRDGGLPASGRAGAGSADPAFVDRVMAAIEHEPAPRPLALGVVAARQGRASGVLRSFRDAWRVAFGSGARSLAARVTALAYVLVAFVVIGSAGMVAVVGTASLLRPDGPATPSPAVSQPVIGPGPTGAPGGTLAPGESAIPSGSVGPGGSGEPAGSTAPGASFDDKGGHGSDDPKASGSPSNTLAPGQTPSPSPTGSDDASPSPSATRTPRPSATPTTSPTATPTGTPKPTSSSSGSGGAGSPSPTP